MDRIEKYTVNQETGEITPKKKTYKKKGKRNMSKAPKKKYTMQERHDYYVDLLKDKKGTDNQRSFYKRQITLLDKAMSNADKLGIDRKQYESKFTLFGRVRKAYKKKRSSSKKKSKKRFYNVIERARYYDDKRNKVGLSKKKFNQYNKKYEFFDKASTDYMNLVESGKKVDINTFTRKLLKRKPRRMKAN